MRVGVGVPELVGDGVEQQVAAFGVSLGHQAPQKGEVGGGLHRGGGDGGAGPLQGRDASLADAQDESVEERDVVGVRMGSRAL